MKPRRGQTRSLLRLLQNVRERNCRKYCRLSAASNRRAYPFQHKISSLCRKQRHFCICRKEPSTGCALTGGFRRNGWLRSGALRGLISKDCPSRTTTISKEEKRMATIICKRNKFNVVYSYYDEAGKRHQKWEAFPTMPEAKQRKSEIEYKQQLGSFTIPTCNTLNNC